jgi:hypothetical protein
MDKLIEALQILLKYDNPTYPTYCSHDKLTINVNPALVSPEDIAKLEELDVYVDVEEDECFYSHTYGSC